MPEKIVSPDAQVIQPTDACGHERKHSRHKRKRDDTHKETELIEQGTVADKKKLTKEKHQQKKRDDDSHKGNELIIQERQSEDVDADPKKIKKRNHKKKADDTHKETELSEQGTTADKKKLTKEKHQKKKRDDDSHMGNELIIQERQPGDVDADPKKIKKRNHKKKTDGPHKESELIKQVLESKSVAADKKKPTEIWQKKRKRDDSHKENELTKQKTECKEAAVDNKKHTKKCFDKRKRHDSHRANELLDHKTPSKEVSPKKKNRVKVQKSNSNDVNKFALSENPNCNGGKKAAGSKAKTEFDRRPSTSVAGQINKGKKTVRFSSDVEVLHSTKYRSRKLKSADDGMVNGRRYTEEEDQIIKDACFKYVEDHNLHEGVKMILNAREYPEARGNTRGCWKVIGASIPYRPVWSVYNRAIYIFRERTELVKWTPDKIKLILSYVEEHGRKFTQLAKHFNVHRHQVKDAWRRNRLPDAQKGYWSVDEYNKFFELVNEDLKMKAFEEKRRKSSNIRENISWWSISDKMATRYDPTICVKWYRQLTSPMVAQGLWSPCDDYHLLFNLSNLDACCFEDVDWDNILKNREGVLCRKRWLEMTRHIGGNVERTFMEQVELLSRRFHIDVLPYRKISLSETNSESEGSELD